MNAIGEIGATGAPAGRSREVVASRALEHRSETPGRPVASWTNGELTPRLPSGTLGDDDALPRRTRTFSRTAPGRSDRRRHPAHPDSPRLGEIDAHAPFVAHTPTETPEEVRLPGVPSERSTTS